MARSDDEVLFPRMCGGQAYTFNFLVSLLLALTMSGPRAQSELGIFGCAQLYLPGTGPCSRVDLIDVRVDKQANKNAGFAQIVRRFPDTFEVCHDVQPALGRYLVRILRH